MKRLEDGDYLFDGFCERPYNEKIDGWRNAMPDPNEYPSVRAAHDVLSMFDELGEARRRIWQLEQELKLWKPVAMQACGFAQSEEG